MQHLVKIGKAGCGRGECHPLGLGQRRSCQGEEGDDIDDQDEESHHRQQQVFPIVQKQPGGHILLLAAGHLGVLRHFPGEQDDGHRHDGEDDGLHG